MRGERKQGGDRPKERAERVRTMGETLSVGFEDKPRNNVKQQRSIGGDEVVVVGFGTRGRGTGGIKNPTSRRQHGSRASLIVK